jgi:hypothetical protein
MTSGVPLTCPSCGEANTTDMAFCIFCGSALRHAPVATVPTGAIPLDVTRVSGGGPRPRTCANCGQTDSLNSVFCIFCGARVDGPLTPAGSLPTGIQAVSGPNLAEQRASRARLWGVVACIVAGGLGAGLGLGVSWYYHSKSEPPKLARDLPAKGLVILTGAPYSSFQVVSDGRRFLTGKTGKDGDIVLDDLEPNKYHVLVQSPEGNSWQGDVAVKSGEPYVIGGETELFTR